MFFFFSACGLAQRMQSTFLSLPFAPCELCDCMCGSLIVVYRNLRIVHLVIVKKWRRHCETAICVKPHHYSQQRVNIVTFAHVQFISINKSNGKWLEWGTQPEKNQNYQTILHSFHLTTYRWYSFDPNVSLWYALLREEVKSTYFLCEKSLFVILQSWLRFCIGSHSLSVYRTFSACWEQRAAIPFQFAIFIRRQTQAKNQGKNDVKVFAILCH